MESRMKLERAIESLKNGRPILIYDSPEREDETDLVFYGMHIDKKAVMELRLTAGGPLCVYVDHPTATQLGLRRFADLVESLHVSDSAMLRRLVTSQGDRVCPYSLTIDFRGNKTGCSHEETATTIAELTALVASSEFPCFAERFRSPGHVPVLLAAKRLLADRKGHTELIVAVAKMGGLIPVMVGSEMISRQTGRSMGYEDALRYAAMHGLEMLTTDEILAALETAE